MKVPTIYARLIQGYHAMDPELQAASASAARNLRLMVREKGTVICIKHFHILEEDKWKCLNLKECLFLNF